MGGPEVTFIDTTMILASISASMTTLPEMCWLRANAGKTGATEESRCAGLTSPPTGGGAAGPLLDKPRLFASAAEAVLAPIAGSGSAPPSREVFRRLTTGAAR